MQSFREGGPIQWSPVQDYVNQQMSNDLSAAAGSITFTQAMQKLQSDLIAYGKAQGFTVK